MKRLYILSLVVGFVSLISAQESQHTPQLGINTTNPQRLVQIDGASTPATTNPQSGSMTDLQLSDDVVITNDGNVGIGTWNMLSKLNIKGADTGAIRIVDGTEGYFRALASDNTSGTTSWTFVGIPWFAFISGASLPITSTYSVRTVNNYSESGISNSTQGAVNPVSGTITVPTKGLYMITVAGRFRNTWNTTPDGLFNAQPIIRINGSSVWSPTVFGPVQGDGVWPTYLTTLPLENGDIVSLHINETSDLRSNELNDAFLFIQLTGLED